MIFILVAHLGKQANSYAATGSSNAQKPRCTRNIFAQRYLRASLGQTGQSSTRSLASQPDGQEYYPAFFADSSEYIRQCLEKVCRALKGIPAYARYQFLTTNSTWFGGGTPLDAIRRAQVDDVLRATKYLLESDRPASGKNPV